jgi:hypothetical protein
MHFKLFVLKKSKSHFKILSSDEESFAKASVCARDSLADQRAAVVRLRAN